MVVFFILFMVILLILVFIIDKINVRDDIEEKVFSMRKKHQDFDHYNFF